MSGAAVLSALGAVRSGAGLTKLAVPAVLQSLVARRAPLEVTTADLPGAAWPALSALIRKFRPDVVAVGPGLGQTAGVRRLVQKLLFDFDGAVVLDADGLNALAAMKTRRPFRATVVLTPHPGEMGRLLARRIGSSAADRRATALEAARRFGATVLLKGAGTVVTDGETIRENTSGNPGMASGGMGDVLTGVIAATWAQMAERTIFTGAVAASLGAFVHGLAGDIATKDFPERTLLASDLAAALPQAFKRLWRHRARGGKR